MTNNETRKKAWDMVGDLAASIDAAKLRVLNIRSVAQNPGNTIDDEWLKNISEARSMLNQALEDFELITFIIEDNFSLQ